MQATLPQAPAAVPAVTIDKIVAVVNNEVITQSRLDKRVSLLLARLASRGVAAPPRRLLARKVLGQMVLQRLQMQYAHRIGINIGQAALTHAEEGIAARNHMTVPQFLQALASQGFTPESFLKRLRVELTIRELVQQRISRSVTVSHHAVSRFLAQARAADGARYHVSLITLTMPAAADKTERARVLAHAEKIQAEIQAGTPFSQAAIASSEDPHALEGGSLGWRTAAHLKQNFVRALQTMKVGEVQIVSGHDAYYLLKLKGRRAGAQGPAHKQVRLREIVLRPSKVLSPIMVREKLEALKARIAGGASFATVAHAYSEASTASQGGSLGWVGVAALPPTLVGPASHLALHQVGGPYDTDQGQVLIEVVGRRTRSGPSRADAKNILRMRKGNALYVRWLQTLRDDAYVRYPSAS